MKDFPLPSRRDWFRLRMPHQSRSLSENTASTATAPASSPEKSSVTSPSKAADGLQPIAHPPNHDGMDLAQLPPMREAVLSIEQIQTLFDDIEKLASDVQVMQRSAGSRRAGVTGGDNAQQLGFAKTALLGGQQQRIQIRYRWQGSQWIDTLASQADGFKLVRIEHAPAV
jgi:hypothetical protein